MINKEDAEVYTEVLTIVNNMNIKNRQKLPQKLIEFLTNNSAQNYDFDIDFSVPLKENKLKPGTKSLLAVLNLQYWCENDDEKKKFVDLYSENEKRYREKFEIKSIYNESDENKERILQKNDNMKLKKLEDISLKKSKWYNKLYKKIISIIRKIF